MSQRTRDKVFISYAREDAKWMEELRLVASPLVDEGKLHVWADMDIQPSRNWGPEIQDALATAKAYVLFVSAEYLASEFVRANEWPRIHEGREQGAEVHWFSISPCAYDDLWFADIQAAHDPEHCLHDMPHADRRRLFVQLAKRLAGLPPVNPLQPDTTRVLHVTGDSSWTCELIDPGQGILLRNGGQDTRHLSWRLPGLEQDQLETAKAHARAWKSIHAAAEELVAPCVKIHRALDFAVRTEHRATVSSMLSYAASVADGLQTTSAVKFAATLGKLPAAVTEVPVVTQLLFVAPLFELLRNRLRADSSNGANGVSDKGVLASRIETMYLADFLSGQASAALHIADEVLTHYFEQRPDGATAHGE